MPNYDLSINDFVSMNASGIQIASFVQIRSALIERYKTVYGDDIDLSTGTADGVFVNDLALIINNILQTMQVMYSNLDVNTASGVYLDVLCALSNVRRKEPTYSNTSLLVTNSNNVATSEFKDLTFVDKAGTEWYHPGTVSFAANETKQLMVTCKTSGNIEAPAGWIDRTLEVTYLTVVQQNNANVGSLQETDSQLRARRTQSSGAAGITVLESLVGALLNVAGIDDAIVYNNNTDAATNAADGTVIDAHSVYVVIRKREGVTIDDSAIGNIIHEKLTPGIHSCDSNGTSGVAKSYPYVSEIYGVTITESEQNVYWKEATPIHPTVTITLNALDFFTSDEFNTIGPALIDYLNSIKLGQAVTTTDVLIEAVNNDPKFKTRPTYTVTNVEVSDVQSDTYYHYTTYTPKNTAGKTWTLVIE